MFDFKHHGLMLREQLCFPLYAASRQVIKMYRPYLLPLGLTYTQYVVMLVLWEENKLNAGELARRLLLDSGTLTPVLKSLDEKGLIIRSRSEADERVLNVELTEKGLQLKEKASYIPEKQAYCARLSQEESAELYRLLYKLLGIEPK